jgi:homopolymeric O-antigen transport system permease protein
MFHLVNPTANVQALRTLARSVTQYRELLWEMTRRDLVERQAGLAFAAFWVIGQPLLMMLVYVFVFSFVFNVRLGMEGGRLDYTAFLLAGLAPWLAFQEAIGRAPTCITENKSLIKQIVFPIEILPLKLVLSTLVPLGLGLAFPLVLTVLAGTARPLSWLLLPIPVLSYLLLTIGLAYLISAAGVFIRDIRNIVQLVLMIGLFAHPILYVPGMLPRSAEMAFELSPFTHVIWIYRDAVLGNFTHPESWLVAPLIGISFLVIGYRIFRSLRHMFGDAL